MKYTTAFIAFAAGALAQSSAITSAPATTSAPAISLSPQISCVSACNAGDVTCQASCLGIARPNSSQAVATNECAARCDQGDGSPEATQQFSDCVQSCIASLFPSSQTGSQIPGAAASSRAAASGTGASGSANPAASTGASGSGSGASQTGSAASQATGAANAISARIGGAGLAGLLAVFVL